MARVLIIGAGHNGLVAAVALAGHGLDVTVVPTGRHSLYVYSHVPSHYALEDEAVAERIEAQIERFAPGFSSLVLARSTRSPTLTPYATAGVRAGASAKSYVNAYSPSPVASGCTTSSGLTALATSLSR
jgi:choline dehydrogenase-like flavoprotein